MSTEKTRALQAGNEAFTKAGRPRQVYVPKERMLISGDTTFRTHDRQRYVRDEKTGVIRRAEAAR